MMGKEFDWPFEISGFGGGYEQACRDMAKAGALWLREHPGELTKWRQKAEGYKRDTGARFVPESVYGESHKSYEAAILKACSDCTGAMFGAASAHARAIFELGWDAYVEKVMSERAKRKAAE